MASKRFTTPTSPQNQAAAWNLANPVGTRVRYFPVIDAVRYVETTTRSEAFVLSGHTAVVFVEGVSGCVAIEALEVRPE